jgi:hypothetical protein
MAKPDLSEFAALSNPKQGPCVTGRALTELDETAAAQLRAALAEPQEVITNAGINAWLAARGFETKWQAVASHRRGACGCARE